MARYGQSIGDIPTETFGPVRGFALREYLVGVKFLNGTSAMEMISRNDQAEITPQEIDALLKKHGADVEWKVDKFEKPDLETMAYSGRISRSRLRFETTLFVCKLEAVL